MADGGRNAGYFSGAECAAISGVNLLLFDGILVLQLFFGEFHLILFVSSIKLLATLSSSGIAL